MSNAPQIPVIETPRLRLRAHTPADFPACLAMWTNADVVRYTAGRPQSREEVWSRLLRYIGHWSLFGYGFWAVDEKATGRFIGELGFADFCRTIEPPLKSPECGWVLEPEFQGRGYAFEALDAAHKWADFHFGTGPTVCLIHPDNGRSHNLAKKLGYKHLHDSSYGGHPTIVYERKG